MDMDTSHRQSAFSRVKEPKVEGAQECKPFHLTELRTVSPQVPHTLPGAGIQNRIPVQPFYPPPDVILQMFQPFHNGNYLPPEVFGRPMGLHGLPPVSTPSTSTETSAMAKDPAIQHLIRQQHEDRDSGNESSTLSPVSSFSSSRSPSNSSRSNSFSMSTLLKPSDLVPQGNIQPAGVNFGLGSSLPPLEAKSLPAHMQHAHLSQLNLFQQNGLQKSLGPFSAMSPLAPNPHQMNAQFMGQIQQFEQFRRLAQNPPFDPLMAGPFREMCDICGDNASGYHYGVMSCEGCKGFFRRTVQKGTEYRCHRDSSCRVDRVTRNRCQSCRYKRCLEKGMAKESVRLDRGRKSKRNGEEAQRQLEDVKEIMTSIEETKASFKAAFPEQVKMQSPQDVVMRCVLFTSALRLFSVVDKEHHDYLAKKSCRGVALLRAALSADECLPVVGEDKELVLKIKAGIEIASYDDLAVLTAVYLASHSDDIELQDQLSRCLRSQLKTRLSNEEHLFSALMGKLALLS